MIQCLIVITTAEKVSSWGNFFLLLLGLLLGSSTRSARSATTTAATRNSLQCLHAFFEHFAEFLGGHLLHKLLEALLGISVEINADRRQDIFAISNGWFGVPTDNRQHVRRNDLHVIKQMCSLLS